MASDTDDYHSESEFYYPDEVQDKISVQEIHVQERKAKLKSQDLDTIQQFIEERRPENRRKKADYDLNVWRRFCSSVDEERELEDIPEYDLNILLCNFFMSVQKEKRRCVRASFPKLCLFKEMSEGIYLTDKN